MMSKHTQTHSTSYSQPQRGFTLLELLIAMAVFAVLSVLAYSGLWSVLSSKTATEQQMEQLQKLQWAMMTMGRDFGQLVDRPVRDELGGTLPAIQSGQGKEQLLEFTRAGRVNPANLPRSHLQRVSYRLQDGQLERLYWHHLDRPHETIPVALPLLDNVNSIEIRYFDNQGQTHESWPPINVQLGAAANLPRLAAIEMVFDLENWGEITRLFEVLP